MKIPNAGKSRVGCTYVTWFESADIFAQGVHDVLIVRICACSTNKDPFGHLKGPAGMVRGKVERSRIDIAGAGIFRQLDIHERIIKIIMLGIEKNVDSCFGNLPDFTIGDAEGTYMKFIGFEQVMIDPALDDHFTLGNDCAVFSQLSARHGKLDVGGPGDEVQQKQDQYQAQRAKNHDPPGRQAIVMFVSDGIRLVFFHGPVGHELLGSAHILRLEGIVLLVFGHGETSFVRNLKLNDVLSVC